LHVIIYLHSANAAKKIEVSGFIEGKMFRKFTSRASNVVSYEQIAGTEKREDDPHQNPEILSGMQRYSGQHTSRNVSFEKEAALPDRPSSPESSESAEAPLLAGGVEQEQDGTTNEPIAATAGEGKKSTFSTAEYKIAFSHFIVRAYQLKP
jgi:hypothetical protein